jgi:hypothetical protein
MASPALTLAAQTNGRNSQGPKTAEGKRKSSANSHKHGFYGKSIHHDAECEADYQRLLACIVDEYQATTPETQTLADTVALSQARQSWALRTSDALFIRAMDALSVPGGTFKPGSPGHPGIHAMPLLHRLFSRCCRQEHKAHAALVKCRNEPNYLRPKNAGTNRLP